MSYWNFLKNNKYLLLFGFLCVFIGNLGQTFFISLFNKDLIENLLLDEQKLSLVYSAATLTSGFTLFFVGSKIDTVEVRKFTLIVVCVLLAACLLFAFSHNMWMLFFAYLGIRLCGQGLMGHIATTTLMRYIPKDRGKAVSLSSQGMAFGEVVLPIMAVALLKNYGFSQSWLIYSGVTLVVMLPLLFWLLHKAKLEPIERQNQNLETSSGVQWSRGQLSKDWRFWCLVPAIIAPAFLITGLFYHQTFWIELKGWSLQWLAVGIAAYGVMHFAGAIFVGPLVDKSHPRVYLRWYLLPLILGVLCLWFGQDKYWLIAFMLLAGLSVAASGPVVNSFYAEVFGTTHLGAIRSMLVAIMILSTGVAPFLFAQFLTLDSFMLFALAYVGLAIVLVQKKILAEMPAA
ncbi:MFS transporter [Kangiella sp. TOML190]|uniref:MFS transporter n=1 Tax=Kangiella sp. TOML190 TaxID=2931351 RepID=UPI002040103D|nr:MFS transporter [Kangiella sp. TOML190]